MITFFKRTILILLAFLLSGSIARADFLSTYKKLGGKSPRWTPLITAGFEAYDDGNEDVAVRFFSQALDKGATDGLVYLAMGIYYEENNDLDRAIKYLRLAEKNLPRRYGGSKYSKIVYDYLGRVLFIAGRLKEAEKKIQKSISFLGKDFTRLFLLGSIARNRGNDEKMIRYYEETLLQEVPPELDTREINVTIMVELGKGYLNIGRVDKSLEMWNKILEIAPNHRIAKRYQESISRKKRKERMEKEEKKILKNILQ